MNVEDLLFHVVGQPDELYILELLFEAESINKDKIKVLAL
jgi:hypothetical protein